MEPFWNSGKRRLGRSTTSWDRGNVSAFVAKNLMGGDTFFQVLAQGPDGSSTTPNGQSRFVTQPTAYREGTQP